MGLLHGTCLEIDGVGVLLRGPPGSGKSDLALRMVDAGARLVADDQVEIEVKGGQVSAVAPEALDGLMEVRGLGVVAMPHVASVNIGLVVDLMPREDLERMPEPSHTEIEGVQLPLFPMAPFESSATAKLKLAVRAVRHDIVLNG